MKIEAKRTNFSALPRVHGMIMTTTTTAAAAKATTTPMNSYYRDTLLPTTTFVGRIGRARRVASRNAVARGKNPAGTQRIPGLCRTFNNNSSMSKAIKTAPKAAQAATTTARRAPSATTALRANDNEAPTLRRKIRAISATTAVPTIRKGYRPGGRRRRIPKPQLVDGKEEEYGNLKATDEPTTWDEMLSARTKDSSLQISLGTSSPTGNLESLSLRQMLLDPLRILDFLMAELNLQLKSSYPEDKTVRRILHEIRAVTKRIENSRATDEGRRNAPTTSQSAATPNVTSWTNLMQTINRVKCCNSSTQTNKRPVTAEACCYAEKATQIEPEDVNWHSLLSSDSIESSVNLDGLVVRHSQGNQFPSPPARRRMSRDRMRKCNHELQKPCQDGGHRSEQGCDCGTNESGKFKNQTKDGDSGKLNKCQQQIASLEIKLAIMQDKLTTANAREAILIHQLEDRCKLLRNDLETLQDIVKRHTNELNSVRELSVKLQESGTKINVLEMSKLEADRILLFTMLEKEKLAILQRFRENQAQALTTEITSLTKVVQDEIKYIHTCTSRTSLSHRHFKKAKVGVTSSSKEFKDLITPPF